MHAFLSLQSAAVLQPMQPSFGSQIGFAATVQAPLSAWLEQTPPLHVSLVHATPSLQSASTQQTLQPWPVQHLSPPVHPVNAHFPLTQATLVVQALRGLQSPSLTHSAAFTQSFAPVSQT